MAAPIATAFVHVNVVPMDRERVLRDQTVITRGDRVVVLGPARQVRVPASAVRIDGRGKYLIPGLADMHVHLWPEMDARAFSDSATLAAYTTDKLFAYVASGVTTVRDMLSGGPTSLTLQLRHRVTSGALLGPRIYTAGEVTPDGPADSPGPADSLPEKIMALKAAGHDFLKLYGWGRPAYDTAMAVAARIGLRVVGHVPDTVAGELPTALQGWASVEHLTGYVNYLGLGWLGGRPDSTVSWRQPGYRLDSARLREVAAATRRAGVWNCPTLGVTAHWLALLIKGDPGWARDTLLLRFRGRIVKALRDAGAGLLLGSDATIDRLDVSVMPEIAAPGPAVHDELRLFVQAGLTPYEALAAGTRNVAQFLGTLDSTGTVAVGKRADLVLLRANPLEDIRQTRALAGVMVGGRWLAPTAITARLETWPANDPDSAPAGSAPREQEQADVARFFLKKAIGPLWR